MPVLLIVLVAVLGAWWGLQYAAWVDRLFQLVPWLTAQQWVALLSAWLLAWGLWVVLGALLRTWQAARVLLWFQRQSLDLHGVARHSGEAPSHLNALWSEVVERCRKLLRQRERRTQAAERRLQAFLSAIQVSPNGVILLDAARRIEWCNQTAAVHLGLQAQRDVLQHITHLVRDPLFIAYLNQGDFEQTLVLTVQTHKPTPMRLSVHAHPYGENRLLLLSTDITALELANGMRRDFVANVSHEIRTPLTVLSGLIESLQTLDLDEVQRRRLLDDMAAQSARINSLVNDLLTLSRLEASPLPNMHARVSVRALLLQCAADARALSAGRHRIVVQFDGQTLEPATIDAAAEVAGADALVADDTLFGAASELQSAFSNLVSNAVRYTPAGGQVTMAWQRQAQGQAVFTVSDTGCGIAAEHIPRLTERFYRADSSRSSETGGTGLGLAIVKHVAQRHGAQLRIESQLGQGSRFSLVFQ